MKKTLKIGRLAVFAWMVFVACACVAVPAEEPAEASQNTAVFADEPAVDPFEIEPLRQQLLAKDGHIFAGIFLSADGAENGDVSAALDIATWLGKVSGAKTTPLVYVEAEEPRSLAEIPAGIYVGNTRAAGKLGIYAPAGEGETGIIETRGNAIFIVGKTPEATCVLAGIFLREFLGVEFVWPGDNGAEWAVREEIPFPRVRREFLPAFPWRLLLGVDKTWAAHLGFGALPRFSHNLSAIFTREVFEEKPQLAPLVLGRERPDLTGGYAPQPNLANADAVPVALAAAKAFFEKNPDAPMFSVGINDSTNWDESEESEALLGEISFFRNLPNRSDYYYAFVNRLADAFLRDAELSSKKIGAIAYLDAQAAPSFPMRKNVVPVLCADRSMWIFPKFKTEDKALIQAWARSGVEMWGVYDYYYGRPFLFPRLFLDEEAEAIKFVHANGGKIFFAECPGVVPFDAPKIWLAAELLRDPDGDPQKILDDYYEMTFGDASPAMKNFYETACEIWREQGGQTCWIKGWNNENSIEIFPPENLAKLRVYVNAALAIVARKAEEDLSPRERRIRERILAVEANLSRAEKFAESYFARKALAQNEVRTLDDALSVLKSPAWSAEEIYSDENFDNVPWRADISKYSLSDPRAATLKRVLTFLKKTENADEKALVERGLERIFDAAVRARAEIPATAGTPPAASSPSDASLQLLSESVPAFDATNPDEEESFEEENFVAYPPGDWRARKNIRYPSSWRCFLASAENFEMGPATAFPHGGKTALRIAGAERAELVKTLRVPAGKKVLAQVFSRGNVSCGAFARIRLDFFDARGKILASAAESLPVGNNGEWRELVALGRAPARTAFASIRIHAGHQGADDEVFFDDFSALVF